SAQDGIRTPRGACGPPDRGAVVAEWSAARSRFDFRRRSLATTRAGAVACLPSIHIAAIAPGNLAAPARGLHVRAASNLLRLATPIAGAHRQSLAIYLEMHHGSDRTRPVTVAVAFAVTVDLLRAGARPAADGMHVVRRRRPLV